MKKTPTRHPPRPAQGLRNPAALLAVPGSVRCLDTLELARLMAAFRAMTKRDAHVQARESRLRLLAIALLLRFSGAKLGEVLGVRPGLDLNLQSGTVALGQRPDGPSRSVALPPEACAELADILPRIAPPDSPGSLAMDQGHVRRKFQEAADAAGLPRSLANPSALRRSRAIELLRANVPLPVVQGILGQGSADLTAALLDFSEADRRRITDQALRQESRKTSARNAFYGRISVLERGSIQSLVQVESLGGQKVSSVVTNESVEALGLRPGIFVTAEIKAPWISLHPGPDRPLTTDANAMPGRVQSLRPGRPCSGVVLELADGHRLYAVVTERPKGLARGARAWALFPALAVILKVE